MLKFESNNEYFEKQILSLIKQKNYFFYNADNTKFFSSVNFNISQDNLKITYDNLHFIHKLPIRADLFFHSIYNLVNNFSIAFHEMEYFPFKQSIKTKVSELYLRDTHNLIICNLLLADANKGINKQNLYKIIWPNDKVMQMNKLDTHLTNIKNLIWQECSVILNISSDKNFLKIN